MANDGHSKPPKKEKCDVCIYIVFYHIVSLFLRESDVAFLYLFKWWILVVNSGGWWRPSPIGKAWWNYGAFTNNENGKLTIKNGDIPSPNQYKPWKGMPFQRIKTCCSTTDLGCPVIFGEIGSLRRWMQITQNTWQSNLARTKFPYTHFFMIFLFRNRFCKLPDWITRG
jgi:hypothetical protein